jgi:hypothetical protein
MTSEDKTAAAEWPLIYTGDDGTLTITRMQMRTGQHNSAGTRSAAPPNYDLAVCDGFWASFTARATGEVYERSIADADVAELLPSSAANLSAELVAEIMSDGQPNTSVTLEAVYAVWPFQLTKRRAAAIEMRMPRAASGGSATGALDSALRACTGRVAELEAQVGSLKTSMSRVLDVLMARVVGVDAQYQMIEQLGLAGGQVWNDLTMAPLATGHPSTWCWAVIPRVTAPDGVERLKSLFMAGLDPDMRAAGVSFYSITHSREYKDWGSTKLVPRNETILQYYVGTLDYDWTPHVDEFIRANIRTLIRGGADSELTDNRGDDARAWLDRAEKALLLRPMIAADVYAAERTMAYIRGLLSK